MAETPESKVKRKARQWVKDNMPGAWHYAAPGGAFGKSGIPDDFWLWRGIFIAVESKADETCQLTKLQMARILEIKRAGGMVAALLGFQVHKLEAIRSRILELTPDWPDGRHSHTSG